MVSYNANKQTVEIFTYANPDIFFYANGNISPDCRRITLFERYSNFSTRKSSVSFVRR